MFEARFTEVADFLPVREDASLAGDRFKRALTEAPFWRWQPSTCLLPSSSPEPVAETFPRLALRRGPGRPGPAWQQTPWQETS